MNERYRCPFSVIDVTVEDYLTDAESRQVLVNRAFVGSDVHNIVGGGVDDSGFQRDVSGEDDETQPPEGTSVAPSVSINPGKERR